MNWREIHTILTLLLLHKSKWTKGDGLCTYAATLYYDEILTNYQHQLALYYINKFVVRSEFSLFFLDLIYGSYKFIPGLWKPRERWLKKQIKIVEKYMVLEEEIQTLKELYTQD